ncbi:MAG: hydrogenase nickel incorporation protein HypA [Fervidicoccaceae archaeon]
MHEWSLAEAVVEAVASFAREHGSKRVKLVRVSLGELQAVDVGIFEEVLSLLGESVEPRIESFQLEREKAVLLCRGCYETLLLEELGLSDEEREAVHFVPELLHAYAKCPRCGSSDLDVIRGRGVSIKSIEAE